jgi:hypothetical protein
LAWRGGPIGITDIDWGDKAWRGWVDALFWLAILCLACAYHRTVSRFAVLISMILISIQIIYTAVMSVQSPEAWSRGQRFEAPGPPPERIFQFSSKANVVHVILDEFQSTVFKDILEKDPGHYQKALDGFVLFEEATGSFPTTIVSLPAILAGKIYDNDVPINSFLRSVCQGRTIIGALAEHGYAVDLAAPFSWPPGREHVTSYQIPVPYGVSKRQHDLSSAAMLQNVVLFRYAPHFLKRLALNHQVPLPVALDSTEHGQERWEGARHFAHKAFLHDLIDRMTVSGERPVYKFIHLTTTHWPAVLNADCEYAGKIRPWTWENIHVQTRCSFDDFLRFLDKLKQLDIYEASCIILQADHGYWKIPDSAGHIHLKNSDHHLDGYFTDDKEVFAQIVCSALPLLAVKPPHGKGPLVVSGAEVMLSDIPATLAVLLDLDETFSGRSVFDVGANEKRRRPFRYYDTLPRPGDDRFGRMDEFIITGSALDKDSWRFVRYLSPE